MIAKFPQGQLTAMAIAALLCVWGTPAAALSLGRITVQSALGEPLKAEIDVLDISAEEASSLVTKVASPEAFRAAGLDYNPALSSLRALLQRRPDGRAYLRISSDRTIGEPFVDMILETRWDSGRILRNYTLLFDPPNLRSHANAAQVIAQLGEREPEQTTLPSRVAPSAVAAETLRSAPLKSAGSAATAAEAQPTLSTPAAAPKPTASLPDAVAQTVKVAPGSTAGTIAANLKPTTVSVDQMLVALVRANPQAFIEDNVNLIKAGAVVTVPSQEEATATPVLEATQIVTAQSEDFNNYRRRFAANVPTVKVAPASQDVSGSLEATVEDNLSTDAGTQTVSKGTLPGQSDEDVLAQARNTPAGEERAAELAKNSNALDQADAAASAAAPATAESEPDLAMSAPEPQAIAPTDDSAAVPAPVAPTPDAATATAALAPAMPDTMAEPSFIDDLTDNPLLPAAVAALIALLAALALYKASQRKKVAQSDSAFDNSDLAFSGGSGGQNVDTSDSLTSGSSMVYSPDQAEPVDDVDPVAEADVYLAYGRDLQAEEILKDALRTDPQRLAIHQKLLDIYVKRGDVKAFDAVAAVAFKLTDGTGTEWEKICKKGIAINSDNALFLPGGQPQVSQLSDFDKTEPDFLPTSSSELAPDATLREATLATKMGDLDLDLDFSVGDAAPKSVPPPAPADVEAMPTAFFDLDDFGETPLPTISAPLAPAAQSPSEQPVDAESDATTWYQPLDDRLDFVVPSPLMEFDFPPTDLAGEPTTRDAAASPSVATDNEMVSFDLDTLSLDFGADKATVAGEFSEEAMDPLETKLALAEEFRAIGDDDGARALIEEVIAEATGDLRAKAQSALNTL